MIPPLPPVQEGTRVLTIQSPEPVTVTVVRSLAREVIDRWTLTLVAFEIREDGTKRLT